MLNWFNYADVVLVAIQPAFIYWISSIIIVNDFCIITYSCCIIRNIFGDHTTCTDGGIIANFNMIDNTDIWANIYIVANYSGLMTAIGTNRLNCDRLHCFQEQ